MSQIRQPAVAGAFYPDAPKQLTALMTHYLDTVEPVTKAPKAIIVPHAGYIYSGPVAASAYARLKTAASMISRVVLIGPSHRVGFSGLAVTHADQFATPLGNIPVDTDKITELLRLPFVYYLDQAHAQEHSLEVQLPFLQLLLDAFTIIPIVAGDASPKQVCELLEQVWGSSETLIVISSDLSHFHDYATARRLDKQTSETIQALDYEKLDFDSACGRIPVCGLLAYARKYRKQIKMIDLRNSGDTAGDKSRVVGYGAYVID